MLSVVSGLPDITQLRTHSDQMMTQFTDACVRRMTWKR